AARAFSFSGRFSVRIETAPDPHARVGAGIAVQFFPSVLFCRSPSVSESKARVQVFRPQFLRALNEEVPRAMDRHSSGCLLLGRFPTFASDRQDRGRVILL